MANYKEMYYKLFRAQVKAKNILEAAEKETEKMYMACKEPCYIEHSADECDEDESCYPQKAK